MNKKLELALDVLDELADSNHDEYYHLMVSNLTTDAQHAAMGMNSTDFTQLKRFVKIVDQLRKEK